MCTMIETQDSIQDQPAAEHKQPVGTVFFVEQDYSRPCRLTRWQTLEAFKLRLRNGSSGNSQNGSSQMCSEATDERRDFWDEFRCLFVVSGIFGIHVVKRIGKESYYISILRVCVGVAIISLLTGCLVVPIVILKYNDNANYDFRIILVCTLVLGMTSSSLFGVWLKHSPQIMAFFAQVDVNEITVRRPRWLPVALIVVCLFPSVDTVIFLLTTPLLDDLLDQDFTKLFLFPLFTSSMFPYLMDIYIMSCLYVVVSGLKTLEGRVKKAEVWTPDSINSIGTHWLRISKLLDTFNGAFSYVLHIRMMFFLVEMISMLFTLNSLQWYGPCINYFPMMAGRIFGATFHFLALCSAGDNLKTAQKDVAGALMEVHANHKPALLDYENEPNGGAQTDPETDRKVAQTQADDESNSEVAQRDPETNRRVALTQDYEMSPKVAQTDPKINNKIAQINDETILKLHQTVPFNRTQETQETKTPTDCGESDRTKGVTLDRPTRVCLHTLLNRMEGSPLEVQIWGELSLGGATYVTCISLVSTYLVVLLQLRQPSDTDDQGLHCFLSDR